MLTNFTTIRKAVKKMNSLDQLMHDKDFNNISKRERLQVQRERAKLDKNLGSIADLTRLPSALFVIDINKEHIAVAEARRLNIPTFALVDTNCNPDLIDFPIPANDDASKSIAAILKHMMEAIQEGQNERMLDKDAQNNEEEEIPTEETKAEEAPVEKKTRARKPRTPKAETAVKVAEAKAEEAPKAEEPKVEEAPKAE